MDDQCNVFPCARCRWWIADGFTDVLSSMIQLDFSEKAKELEISLVRSLTGSWCFQELSELLELFVLYKSFRFFSYLQILKFISQNIRVHRFAWPLNIFFVYQLNEIEKLFSLLFLKPAVSMILTRILGISKRPLTSLEPVGNGRPFARVQWTLERTGPSSRHWNTTSAPSRAFLIFRMKNILN